MIRARLALIAFLAFSSFEARANTTIGNGGDALICAGPTPIRMLDIYEAELRGFSFDIASTAGMSADRRYSRRRARG